VSLLPGEINILPDGIEQFSTTHACAERGENKNIPPKWGANLHTSDCLYHPGTLIIAVNVDFTFSRLGLANMSEWTILDVATLNNQIE